MSTKTIVDYMSEQDYTRYNELIALAEQTKDALAAVKAVKKPRRPMTVEQKTKAAEARLAKAQAALEALLAAQG